MDRSAVSSSAAPSSNRGWPVGRSIVGSRGGPTPGRHPAAVV